MTTIENFWYFYLVVDGFFYVGAPTIFTQDEESRFAHYCMTIADWGYPIDRTDLRLIVKAYLNKAGRVIPKFKDNMPGDDWARNFIERQPEILKE